MTTNGNGAGGLGHGYYFEDLAVGMEASYAKKITNDDVLAFAGLSGDVNPVHLSDDFAAGTIFKSASPMAFSPEACSPPCSAPSCRALAASISPKA